VNELNRDIALAILKRLLQRRIISDEIYRSCCNSRYLELQRFSSCEEEWEDNDYDDDSQAAARTAADGKINL